MRDKRVLIVAEGVTLETCPPLDVLVMPGGWGTRREIGNQRLLDGRRATTHWRSLDRMRQSNRRRV